MKSQLHGISRGIPRGSVMGPLLFNILINDLNAATKKLDLIMYADDTTLVSTHETFRNAILDLQKLKPTLVMKFLKLQLGFIVIN